MNRLFLAIVAALTAAAPVRATWLEARTDHFVIDADTSEAKMRDFAGRLERFDAALGQLYGVTEDSGRRANRVIVFAVDGNTVSRLCRGCPSQVAGFYTPHAGSSVIVTSALGAIGVGELTPQAVLLHEYSHHFMYTHALIAYPLWYSEGFAEFNGNSEFRPDGGVVIGLPAQYRAAGLLRDIAPTETGRLIGTGAVRLTVRQLLDPPAQLLRNPVNLEQLYGRGWLLTHYLELSPTRRGQLAKYLTEMNRGTPSLAAAQAAFGDIDQLGAELARYLSGNRFLPPLLVPPAANAPKIEIVALSAGAAAMMPAHMRSVVGTTRAEAEGALPGIAARAGPFAGDARVQIELAEAAYDAGDDAAAEAAADRALAADPANITALLYKGQAQLRGLAVAKNQDPAKLAAARAWLVKANRIEPDAAGPLLAYYHSFVDTGGPPSASAVNGLLRAEVVAPEDPGVRWLLARHFLGDNDPASAREVLQPIAFAPHAGSRASLPRQVIDRIDAKDLAGARKLMASDTEQTNE